VKNLKAIKTGALTAITIFLLLVIAVVFFNIIFDYIGGKEIQTYFTFEFVIEFAFRIFSRPEMLGLLAILIILSCLNQIKIAKERAHNKTEQ